MLSYTDAGKWSLLVVKALSMKETPRCSVVILMDCLGKPSSFGILLWLCGGVTIRFSCLMKKKIGMHSAILADHKCKKREYQADDSRLRCRWQVRYMCQWKRTRLPVMSVILEIFSIPNRLAIAVTGGDGGGSTTIGGAFRHILLFVVTFWVAMATVLGWVRVFFPERRRHRKQDKPCSFSERSSIPPDMNDQMT